MHWELRARCRRLDRETADEVIYGKPTKDGVRRHTPETLTYARNLCEGCEVRETCLIEALMVPQPYDLEGIRGGLLPRERKALRFEMKVVTKDGIEWKGGPVDGARRRRGPH